MIFPAGKAENHLSSLFCELALAESIGESAKTPYPDLKIKRCNEDNALVICSLHSFILPNTSCHQETSSVYTTSWQIAPMKRDFVCTQNKLSYWVNHKIVSLTIRFTWKIRGISKLPNLHWIASKPGKLVTQNFTRGARYRQAGLWCQQSEQCTPRGRVSPHGWEAVWMVGQ